MPMPPEHPTAIGLTPSKICRAAGGTPQRPYKAPPAAAARSQPAPWHLDPRLLTALRLEGTGRSPALAVARLLLYVAEAGPRQELSSVPLGVFQQHPTPMVSGRGRSSPRVFI